MAIIHVVATQAEADLNVFVAESRGDADLFVYKSESRAEAREPGWWFFTDLRAEAEHNVCLVDTRGLSDLNICFVEHPRDAGWRVSDHPYVDRV